MENEKAFEFKTQRGEILALNLYAGIGGNRKLWPENVKVTAVEHNEEIAAVYKSFFPQDNVIVGDAHQYLLDHYNEFDFIWASPPCQTHSRMNIATRHKKRRYPDMKLYEEIIFLQNFFEGKWIIENVKPYYEPLITPSAAMSRHLFWTNFRLTKKEIAQPKGFITISTWRDRAEIMDWLGMHFDTPIYYNNNKCPIQVLRNCVHPELGLHVFNCAVGVLNSNASPQKELWNANYEPLL
jgi:DNA (cytosine-5)-methyltransferase 1